MTQGTAFSALVSFGLLLSTFVSAQARPLTFEFHVEATSGPLTGQMATGTFTFDSNIIPPGGGQVFSLTLFSDLAFTWDGIQYTTANTQTSSLTFDSAGKLIGWTFGTTCQLLPPPGCNVVLLAGRHDWVVNKDPIHTFLFEYGRPDLSFGFGTSTVTPIVNPPPPPPTGIIPTLSESGQIIMIILLIVCALWTFRRRRGRIEPT